MDFKPFKIGKYLLLERIATGGMAEVYRAKASGAGGFEKQLAIKRILPSYSSNEEFRRMFEYEARLSSMLTQANIVQIYDFVKSGDTYLLAMEYVDGKNLRQFVNKARKLNFTPPIEFGVYVINEVCKGLEYAHKKKDDLTGKPLNIIHRDMSPQNIMLSYDGAVKIVDFGIAKAKDRVDETRSGVIKGKFGYMSPEQANGEPVDHRTDIFSTGIILYELLTSKRLFAADNDMATLKQIQECVVPPPSRLNPKVIGELEKILMKALTKDLSLRYQNAGVFHRNLQEFMNKHFSSFTQREVAEILQKIFNDEITAEKKRFEQIYRQSIPFSQGASKETEESGEEDQEEGVDGSITKSEKGDRTAVTYVGDEEGGSLGDSGSADAFDPSISRERTNPGKRDPAPDSTKVEPVFLEEEEDVSIPTQANERSADDIRMGKLQDPDELSPLDPDRKQEEFPTSERTLVKQSKTGRGGLVEPEDPEEEDRTGSFNTNPSTPGRTGGGAGKKSASGIELSAPDSSTTGLRRRERSYSASHDVSGSANEPISLAKVNEEPSLSVERTPPSRARQQEPFRMSDPVDYQPRRKSTALRTFLIIVLILGAGAILYRQQEQGQPGPIVETPEPGTGPVRGTTGDDPGEVVATPPEENVPKSYGDCSIEITSDPAGARIFIDGVDRGTTATTLSTGCNKALNLTLRLDGYADVNENYFIKRRQDKIIRVLKKVPTGRLEVIADQNARVFVDDKQVGELTANAKFELTLKARPGKRYKVRFVNEVYNYSTECEIPIEEDRIERLEVSLPNKSCRR